MNGGAGSTVSHDALVGQDNVVYYCDSNYVGSFFEIYGQTFNPLNNTTYTFAKAVVEIPTVDQATCLAELGINLMIGGIRNLAYPWNRTGTVSGSSILNSYSYPIWFSESLIQRMITIKNNTYVFVGNRGNIHITNGSQSDIWMKVPDHISGTVEPYFQWGGCAGTKDELLFSMQATDNNGTKLTTYGGIWAVNVNTKTLRLVNELSYGTNGGYAPALMALIPMPGVTTDSGNPKGLGFYAGWDSGASIYGRDRAQFSQYTSGQSIIETEIIPIGTFNKPRNLTQIEYKLSTPLVGNESIEIQQRLFFGNATVSPWTSIFVDTLSSSPIGLSNTHPTDFANAQWIQFKIILTSTASSPSYVRLKQIRVLGLQGPTLQQQQNFSI